MTVTVKGVAASAANSGKKIDAIIKTVQKDYETAKERVQTAAIMIVEHAMAYGDCDRAKKLVRAVPARERNSLIGYFQIVSPIGVKMGKTVNDDACKLVKVESKGYNPFSIDKAKALKWYDDPAGANPEPKPLNTYNDFFSIVDGILAKAIKDADKDDKYSPDDRDRVKNGASSIRVLVNKFRATELAAQQASADAGQEAVPPVAVTA